LAQTKEYYEIADESDIVYTATLLDPRLNLGFLIEHLGVHVASDIIHAIALTLKKYYKVMFKLLIRSLRSAQGQGGERKVARAQRLK
jgi:hypothetical protein